MLSRLFCDQAWIQKRDLARSEYRAGEGKLSKRYTWLLEAPSTTSESGPGHPDPGFSIPLSSEKSEGSLEKWLGRKSIS